MVKISIGVRFSILFAVLCEHSIAFMIPTYVAYMVQGFIEKSTLDKELTSSISYHVGTLEGTNRLMAFFGCFIWGSISDKIGRKNSLMIVLFMSGVTSIGFSFSTTFYVALAWRALAGISGGTITITKALLKDLSDDGNISILYGYFGTGYGIASIIGPLIGGYLSHPYRNTELFDYYFFYKFPYFLPQLAHATITLLGFLLVLIYIPSKPPEPPSGNATKSLLKNKNYLLTVGAFCFLSFVQFSFRILLALWVKTSPKDGGLGWHTEEKPGKMNSLSGIIVTLFPFIFTPWLSRKFGVKKSSVILLGFLIPTVLFASLGNNLDGIPLWVLLIICNGFAIALCTAFISFISIAVSNSVESNITGAALGMCQGIVSFSRAIAVFITGNAYGLSLKWNIGFPFDSHFVFIILCLVSFADIFFIIYFLDASVEKRVVQSKTTAEDINSEVLKLRENDQLDKNKSLTPEIS